MEPTHKSKQAGSQVEKMPRLPKNARVHKRALLRPQISSPYADRSSPKVVYVSSKTPFMSAVKRVQMLLNQIRKRSMQAELSRQKKGQSTNVSAAEEKIPGPEPVIMTATGKAIDKALSMALFFQNQRDTLVKIKTTSADAVDDILPQDDVLPFATDNRDENHSDGGVALYKDVDKENTAGKPFTSEADSKVLEDLPGSRIRHTSVIQIYVTMQ